MKSGLKRRLVSLIERPREKVFCCHCFFYAGCVDGTYRCKEPAYVQTKVTPIQEELIYGDCWELNRKNDCVKFKPRRPSAVVG